MMAALRQRRPDNLQAHFLGFILPPRSSILTA